MNVYLDNYVVVAIENGQFTLDNIRSLLPGKVDRFYYSSAHIREAHVNAESYDNEKMNDFLTNRFDTLRQVFDKNYLYVAPADRLIHSTKEDPLKVYNSIELKPSLYNPENMILNIHSTTHRREIREQVGIEEKKLLKYSPKEVVKHFTTKFELNFGIKRWETNMHTATFQEEIEKCISLLNGGRTSPLHYRIAGTFKLINKYRYWKFKQPARSLSEYADLWDIDHIFFASWCDYFICDDKKTRNIATVAYDLFGLKTKIISPKGEE